MSTIRVQYGLRIKDLRDERGLSQRGFAARIGMVRLTSPMWNAALVT